MFVIFFSEFFVWNRYKYVNYTIRCHENVPPYDVFYLFFWLSYIFCFGSIPNSTYSLGQWMTHRANSLDVFTNHWNKDSWLSTSWCRPVERNAEDNQPGRVHWITWGISRIQGVYWCKLQWQNPLSLLYKEKYPVTLQETNTFSAFIL